MYKCKLFDSYDKNTTKVVVNGYKLIILQLLKN